MPNQLSDEQRQLAVSFITTEHFTLQTARTVTTSESSGRATLFLSTLSSALVALGFVAQRGGFNHDFDIFALLVLPPIAFLGLITFQRAMQSALEDSLYAQGMNRIRQFYVELVPEMRRYFILPTRDTRRNPPPGNVPIMWQAFLTFAAAIGVVNSVLVGAIVGIAVDLVLSPSIMVLIVLGIAVALLGIAGHYLYQQRQWADAHRRVTYLDDSAPAPASPDRP